tara:strand:+ start:117 stop:500 length:384 start_codon:yes stop_codon:yes gene_type:complete
MASPSEKALIPATKRFNRWQFTEAQALFSDLSDMSKGREIEFYMAISNIAGGFSKIWHKGGEPHAMVSLLTAGIDTLQRFTPNYLEYELEDFFKSLVLCLTEAKRWRRGETEIFNRDLIPRLRTRKS